MNKKSLCLAELKKKKKQDFFALIYTRNVITLNVVNSFIGAELYKTSLKT